MQQNFISPNRLGTKIHISSKKIIPTSNSVDATKFPRTAAEREKQEYIETIYKKNTKSGKGTITSIYIYYKDKTSKCFNWINGKLMQVISADDIRIPTILINHRDGSYQKMIHGVIEEGGKFIRK